MTVQFWVEAPLILLACILAGVLSRWLCRRWPFCGGTVARWREKIGGEGDLHGLLDAAVATEEVADERTSLEAISKDEYGVRFHAHPDSKHDPLGSLLLEPVGILRLSYQRRKLYLTIKLPFHWFLFLALTLGRWLFIVVTDSIGDGIFFLIVLAIMGRFLYNVWFKRSASGLWFLASTRLEQLARQDRVTLAKD